MCWLFAHPSVLDIVKPPILKFQKPLENEEKIECVEDGEANSFIYHDEHTNNVVIEHARDFFIINFWFKIIEMIFTNDFSSMTKSVLKEH